SDGAGSIAYSLTLGATNVATGLYALDANAADGQGEAIVLVDNGGIIEGQAGAGGDVIFTIDVNGDGEVTFTQLANVWHPDDTDADDVVSLVLDADELTLEQTVTDADGDSVSAAIDLGAGGLFSIRDDGPSITTDISQLDELVVNETFLADPDSREFAFVDYSAAFTIDFGADGEKSLEYALSIDPAIATATGLTDTVSGEAVVLSLNTQGHVEGRTETSNELVFTVSTWGNGVERLVLTQDRAMKHPAGGGSNDELTLPVNAISFTATATDNDGDSTSESLAIGAKVVFLDDEPSITTIAGNLETLTVDESALGTAATANFANTFDIDFGADGEGRVEYELGINTSIATNLVDTATDHAVVLSVVGGVVEGRTENSDQRVFTVSVDGNGNVTLTQERALKHPDETDPNDAVRLPAEAINLTARAFDGDLDSVSGTVNLGANLVFRDDGPSVEDDSATQANRGDPVIIDVVANDDAGADGVELATGVNYVDGSLSGNGTLINNNDGTFTYEPAPAEKGDVTFQYTLTDRDGDTSAPATATITLQNSVPTASDADETMESIPVTPTTNVTFIVDVSASMSDRDIDLTEDAIDSIISQYLKDSNVNVNIVQFWGYNSESTGWQDGSGTNAQGFLYKDKGGTDPGEGLEAVVNAYNAGVPSADQEIAYFMGDGSPYEFTGSDYRNYQDTYENILLAWQDLVKNVFDRVQAFGINEDADGNQLLSEMLEQILSDGDSQVEDPIYVEDTDDFDDIVDGIVIPGAFSLTGNLLDSVTGGDGDIQVDSIVVDGVTYTADGAGGTTQLPDGGVRIDGQGRLEVDFDTGAYAYNVYNTYSEDIPEKTFGVNVSDEDGDIATFNVVINTPETDDGEINSLMTASAYSVEAENETLMGGDEDDVLVGGAGNELIVGGAGDDTLTGGAGDDVFAWYLGDEAEPGQEAAEDVITDFGNGNDVLDLAEILGDADADTIGEYIYAEQDGSDTVLSIKSGGGIDAYGSNADQVITLEDVTVSGGDSASILERMLTEQQLKLDQ
ncbi:DUF5801 repeats-in-toxin domain-containing protein, partial [Halomonas urumqiensis]